jgi:HSP20 family protein
MTTKQEQIESGDATSSPASEAPAPRRRRGLQALLVTILGLLIVTVGVQAWFLRDLKQEVAVVKQRSSEVSSSPAWIQQDEDSGGQASNPFEELQRMHDALSRSFGRSMDLFGKRPFMSMGLMLNESPSVDIREEPDRFVVKADVPGATAGSVKVDLDGQQLTIQGTRESQSEQKDQNGRIVQEEREAGVFSRSVMLPGPVASSGMKTDVHDGVLTITIPKLS